MKERFLQQLHDHTFTVGIVGLGYVGLPLVQAFARQDLSVLGLDIDEQKVTALKQGRSYIEHIPATDLKRFFVDQEIADASTDFSRAAECQAILICVPTPLDQHRDPDLSYIESTGEALAPHLREGQLICLESTTYPGTTEEVLVPILERHSGLQAGRDFFVAYSPEREDPNNKDFNTTTIPKVVGGLDADSRDVACALYQTIIKETVPVSSCRVAEATKLMENIFRCVNIALVNEMKVVLEPMGIDIYEVIDAAKTKPFGFMPFYPGPGLGGHCIPIDPFYLSWKAREYDQTARFIELAGEVNTGMPTYVIQKTIEAMNEEGLCLNGNRILLVGLAYKGNVDDLRESPTFVIWEELVKRQALVDYYDPHIAQVHRTREHPQFAGTRSRTLEQISAEPYDCMIICTAHNRVDHEALKAHTKVIVDTRGVLAQGPGVYRA